MNILFYFGGFAPVGGIETFCKNLLVYFRLGKNNCSLICWGENTPILKSIKHSGVKIFRSPWRWGNKWQVPDLLLLPFGLNAVKSAEIIIFGKVLPVKLIQFMRRLAPLNAKFVFITPYKPGVPDSKEERSKSLTFHNLFDLIIVQGMEFKKDLEVLGYKGEIKVLPYITHQTNNIQPFPSTNQLKIGFLGRLVEDKNIPLLLKAFKVFQQKYLARKSKADNARTPTLHIFGDGGLREELEKNCLELSLSSDVIFHGAIPNSEIEASIFSCHLFAFTSNIEGQCLAALEILSYGRPIVTSEAGAFPDILDDTRLGKLVKNIDADTFSDALLDTIFQIEDKTVTPYTIKAAYLERYASDVIGKEYEILFRDILKKPPSNNF